LPTVKKEPFGYLTLKPALTSNYINDSELMVTITKVDGIINKEKIRDASDPLPFPLKN